MKYTRVLTGACVVACLAGQVSAAPSQLSPDEASAALARGKAALQQNPDLEFIPGQVLVKFRFDDQVINDAARRLVNGRLIRTLKGTQGVEHLEVGMSVERAVETLKGLPFVEYAEPDYVVRPVAVPNDQFIGLQWGVNNTGQDIRGVLGVTDADIDGFEAWDVRTSAANVVVAVIDSGVQWSHPDLDGNIWSNSDEIAGNGQDDDGNGYVDDVRGWDFYNNDNNPDDADGHGTHCSGTVGAEGNNGIGVAGVAWDVQIMPLRFIGPFGGSTSDAVEAVNYAVANGADISNNSWGGGGFSSTLSNAIANAAANDHLFVAAAGNDGLNTDSSPHYPSSYSNDNIISVAATDNRDRLAGFSNYGVNSVDLGAPGVDIASTYSGSGYVWSSGTSMAAPHVAGAAAVLLAENPSWSYSQVRDRLFSTVRPTSAMSGTTATGGVLNLADALGGGGNPGNTAPTASIGSPSNGATFTEGTSVSFSGSASDNEDGNISGSLAWTSSLDGSIGSGASFSTATLSVGTHTITASVTDSGGLSADDSISVTIEADQPANTPPTANISSPGNGSTFTEGASVSFSGSGSDGEDGNVSGSLAWTSSRDGAIGSGASFSTSSLSVGTHTITATATDSGGLTGSDSISITIEADQPADTPPATPGRPIVSDAGNGVASITWADNSNNEDSFEIQRQERVARQWTNTTTVGSVGSDVTSYSDSAGNGRFRYRVRAVNAAGASSWSSWRSVRLR